MDIRRKIEMAERAIEMVAAHDSSDLLVREAALKRLENTIAVQRRLAQDRAQVNATRELGGAVS